MAAKKIHTLYLGFHPDVKEYAYVGQTFQKLEARWRQHQYEPREENSRLWDALNKSDPTKWKVWIIGQTKYAYLANHLEEVFIRLLGTRAPNGCNLAGGGRSSKKIEMEKDAPSLGIRPETEEDLKPLWKREVALYNVRLLLCQAGSAYSPEAALRWHKEADPGNWFKLTGTEAEMKMARPYPEEYEKYSF